jgi:hypothetical protein
MDGGEVKKDKEIEYEDPQVLTRQTVNQCLMDIKDM